MLQGKLSLLYFDGDIVRARANCRRESPTVHRMVERRNIPHPLYSMAGLSRHGQAEGREITKRSNDIHRVLKSASSPLNFIGRPPSAADYPLIPAPPSSLRRAFPVAKCNAMQRTAESSAKQLFAHRSR